MTIRHILTFCLIITRITASCQDILPPQIPWQGKSERLLVRAGHPWITAAEKSGFRETASLEETQQWFAKLCESTPLMRLETIGKTAQNREIVMIIASSEGSFTPDKLKQSERPLVLVQGGIHAGEIDGKDAGMMLLRDIAHGDKRQLLSGANLLFIPVLNPDGHERMGPYNRVNQRGPENMGWRTNSKNLNLNRDYAKLDTEEIRAIVTVINRYDPELYIDVHVTDGADYQYDITYGFAASYSPSSASWLKNVLSPFADEYMRGEGHVPGPLIFATNGRDFSEGITDYAYSARFSHAYGDVRHLPTILVENHSLKPFRQRVLGTYVFLESILKVVAEEGPSLLRAIDEDRRRRNNEVVITWKADENPGTMKFLGIESKQVSSAILPGTTYTRWTGKTVTQDIPVRKFNTPDRSVARPSAFWIPVQYQEVIERLRIHGIVVETQNSETTKNVHTTRIMEPVFASQPSEGRTTVSGKFLYSNERQRYPVGSVRVPTNQPLGELAIHLLHPESPESFLQWGFFPGIFSRTEYMEEYILNPLAEKMLLENAALKKAFDEEAKNDASFAGNRRRIFEWFYSRTPYFDSYWRFYPIGMEP